ncbi:MAG TPA: hypothetical protein VEU74_12100 [Gemmatimonadales bacterium]|nr:hypothetical protein [Gemmatimonadales bacterium]
MAATPRRRPVEVGGNGGGETVSEPLSSGIGNWLRRPSKSVTRAEFWEILNRYEAGRAADEERRIRLEVERAVRARAWHRRLWRWLRPRPSAPAPVAAPTPLEGRL